MRLFIALNCNTEQKYFQSLQKQFPLEKLTFPKEFHITLKFLGEVSEEKKDEIIDLLEKIKNSLFTIKTGEIEEFNKRVIILKIVSDETILLQKNIDEILRKIFPKEIRFQAHVTLARIKSLTNEKAFFERIKKIKTEVKDISINSLQLIESTLTPQGSEYKIVYEKKFQ